MPEQNARIRSNVARNTIYTHGLPANHVIEVADGVQISCPELLFIELGTIMSPVVQLLVGLELCGRFSRCGAEPRNGPVTFGVKQVTTAKKIRAYLANANDVAGLERSRRIAEWLMDEAWSPQESVVDALARMPLHELGYELGELRLNPRVMAGGDAELLVAKRSRVPNTLVVGTSVGFNYHGGPHFGEDFDEDAEPNFQQNGVTAIGPLRASIVTDKHRDRDLLVQGLSVLPVTKEDLLERGGLDCVMLQAMSIIERLGQSDSTRADSPLFPIVLHGACRHDACCLGCRGYRRCPRRWQPLGIVRLAPRVGPYREGLEAPRCLARAPRALQGERIRPHVP